MIRPLVVGGSMSSLSKAESMGAYLLLNSALPDHHTLSHPGALGPDWSNAYWRLFYRGLVFSEEINSIQITSPNDIHVYTRFGATQFPHEVENIYISSLENVALPEDSFEVKSVHYHVRDYFEVSSGTVHDLWQVDTHEDFVQRIQFYITERIDGNKNKKDFFALSKLKEQDLYQFEFSDTMVKFKCLEILNRQITNSKKIEISHTVRTVEKNEVFTLNQRKYPFLKRVS